ncbi:Ig-like domain-containing protein [Bradyrhizobium sp. 15]|uniref:Ig-like domain-containing protein n=1 Tax=Bradyrhizobium sp. 15 TaxID=2782633 RepID=UPI001FF839E9|nr:hypothetical protein [Bradyrhizobium sp. 15]
MTEALVSDTGTSATDHVTANPAVSGTGLANTVVHFTIDGSPIAATVTTDAQGAWSFTPSGLGDGSHTIVASQTDSFGNTGSASLSFTSIPRRPPAPAGRPPGQPDHRRHGGRRRCGRHRHHPDGTTATHRHRAGQRQLEQHGHAQ